MLLSQRIFYLLFLSIDLISTDSTSRSTQTMPTVSTKSIGFSHQIVKTVNATSSTTSTKTSIITTSPTSSRMTTTTTKKKTSLSTPFSVQSLIDQFNSFRQQEILNRLKQCSSTMKLTEICEFYDIDQRTNQLRRSSVTEFQSLEHVADSLVDRMAVQKLRKFCSIGQWCLGNLSGESVQFTLNIIRKFGEHFCTMDQCHHRLQIYTKSCPSRSNQNITLPTLKLLPMICQLHHEQNRWNQTICMHGIVDFLHLIYAHWSQFENCYRQMTTNDSISCSNECQMFDELLHRVDHQCQGYSAFLTKVPTFSWFKTINLKEICEKKNISMRPAFISSVQTFFTQNTFWYRFHQKPVYTASFVLIVLSFVITLSLCCYVKSKQNRLNASNRRSNDDYEYTRLHNTSFELGTSTEIPNNSQSNRLIDESHLDTDDHLSFSEYQRLLHLQP